ncbi:late embryogenesis abundant protein D-113-like protein [Gossypium australe]|uniref:Late embryogenesis abundant protein D-113-like protein n=1 Tax=Gossypium australe TaxID=47621 RepID=A0A5B6VGG2_9ROSI|nr:late embryogenesis abundant protein D-113-like protein [Gossypium australe]
MQGIKDKASNAAASAKSGWEKVKATVGDKVLVKTKGNNSNDAKQEETVSQKKEVRMEQAELDEEEARLHDAVTKHTGGDGGFTAAGTDLNSQGGWIPIYPTAAHYNGGRSFPLK